jgi:acyl-CoA synthetase (AMP-forming)/AMP-acid ligase II
MVSFLALLLSRQDAPRGEVSMRGLLTGGSAIDAGLIRAFEAKFGVPVRTIYGLTESASIATCEFADPAPRSLGSSGRALPVCEIRIRLKNGECASASSGSSTERGEIWIKGPTVFEEYIADPHLTQLRKQNGWLCTGDIGYFDEAENLFVVDRLDSMLIVGGENVYPAEVERFGTLLPDAAQIVLAGIDHEIWGKELVLVYKSVSRESVDVNSWHRRLADQLAVHKLPRRYVPIAQLGLDEFPRKENGKLDRQVLARLLQKSLSI